MAKRPLKELFNLNKVEEVSICTSKNPPANGFTQFEIMKNSFNKSEFEELFTELAFPEYGDFVGYLNLFLEDDVNQVAYKAFIDALFMSLNEVCFDKESTKEEKALKMKDNFDKFIEEYKSSVITKSEDGKVFLNIEKPEQKNIEKQENSMNPLMEALKKLLAQFSSETETEEVEIEEACGDKIKKAENEEEIIPAEEVSEEAKIEEVVEPEQAPELAETPVVEEVAEIEVEKTEEPIIEEPKIEEEIPAVEAPEVVEEPIAIEEPKVEGDEEPIEEPVQKSEEPSIEEILKAKENELEVLKSKIEKAEQIQKESEIKLEKAELLKSIESQYSGLVGTSEEVLERVYEINKSELSLETKEFALEGLKKLSAKNLELTKEVGVEIPNEIVNSEEEIQKSKIQKAVSEHNLTEGQALLYVRGERTLKQAKEISLKKK